MRSTHRHLEQHEVLTAAVAVAVDPGLHAVSPASVAERLGVRPKAVAAFFPDADDLVAATFARMVGDELAETIQSVLAHPSPTQQLTTLIGVLAEPVPHLDAVWRESWSLGRRNAALGAAVRRLEDGWHTLIADVVRNGVDSGDFLEVDADQVATHLLVMMNGVNAYSLVGYQREIDWLRLLHAAAGSYLGVTLSDDSAPIGPA